MTNEALLELIHKIRDKLFVLKYRARTDILDEKDFEELSKLTGKLWSTCMSCSVDLEALPVMGVLEGINEFCLTTCPRGLKLQKVTDAVAATCDRDSCPLRAYANAKHDLEKNS